MMTALPKSDAFTLAGIEKLDSIATTTLAKIKAIAPPSSISSGVKRWLVVVEQEEGDVSEIISDLKTGKTNAALALGRKGSALDAQTNSDAMSLGLPSCTVNAQPSGG
jgi:hypothetical protein